MFVALQLHTPDTSNQDIAHASAALRAFEEDICSKVDTASVCGVDAGVWDLYVVVQDQGTQLRHPHGCAPGVRCVHCCAHTANLSTALNEYDRFTRKQVNAHNFSSSRHDSITCSVSQLLLSLTGGNEAWHVCLPVQTPCPLKPASKSGWRRCCRTLQPPYLSSSAQSQVL